MKNGIYPGQDGQNLAWDWQNPMDGENLVQDGQNPVQDGQNPSWARL